jgi:hypothetical protein
MAQWSKTELQKAFGSDEARPVQTRAHGPFGVAQLAAELAARLKPGDGIRPGRPTDPAWDVRRLVGFRRSTWHELTEIARQASSVRRRVTPSQVAALLVERGLESLEDADSRRSA